MERASWRRTFVRMFGTNMITAFGAALTTGAAIVIIAMVVIGLVVPSESPYIGIVGFLVMPSLFVLGLLLIPLGLWVARRRGGGIPQQIDLRAPTVKRAVGLVALLTAANVIILGLASYRGLHHMDSPQFCGQVCHDVMSPEFTAFTNSPHARVSCVECHIGPGAPWFVRSKLSGLGQVFAVAFDTYPRPIPSPVENLRPSRDTCEQCHWPARFTGDRVRVITRYAEDERNTPLKTVLVLHIGGGRAEGGIHSWHIDPRRQTSYVSDATRETISLVQVREPGGKVLTFRSPAPAPQGATPASATTNAETSRGEPAGERREMDCIDCHNRPTHVFELPGPALDTAMLAGRIDPALPWIKKVGREALEAAGTGTRQQGLAAIDRHVRGFYQSSGLAASHAPAIDAAVRELHAIYQRNVFPHMKVTWGTYPTHIGHERSPGCFRCHDGEHAAEDGAVIRQDCDICHTILAVEEENPEVLAQLQVQ